MLQNNRFEEGLLEAYGWYEILSKNPIMISYLNDDLEQRLNYYFTTGTVTIQGPNCEPQKYTEIFTDEQMEEILCKI